MLIRYFLAAAMLLLTTSCVRLQAPPVRDTLQNSRPAVVHLLYGDRSCSAFHIGGGQFITAAHCFGSDLGGDMEEITMINERNFHYFPKVVKYNEKKDLVLLSAPDFKGPAVELWDSGFDGQIPKGMEMLTLGYPGYYGTDFQFEHGFVKDVTDFYGTEMVISEEASYAGESGGAAISTENGKVIGMTDAGIESIQWLRFPLHIHVSLSLFVSANEIRAFLK